MIRWIWRWVCMFCFIASAQFPVGYLFLCLSLGGWKYELVGNRVMRAWHIRSAGYHGYTYFGENGPVVLYRFELLGVKLRVGPWIDPEWVTDPEAGVETNVE